MSTYSLDLSFTDDRNNALPHPPRAWVYVKAFSLQSKDGRPLVTPDCLCMEEMEFEINRLQRELEEIRKTAREKFHSEEARWFEGNS